MKFKFSIIMLFFSCGLQGSNSDLSKLIVEESLLREQISLTCRKELIESGKEDLARITNVSDLRERLRNPDLTKEEFRKTRYELEDSWRYLLNGKKIHELTDKIEKNHGRALPFIPNYISPKVFKRERLDLEKVVNDVLRGHLKKKVEEEQPLQYQHGPSAPMYQQEQVYAKAIEAEVNAKNI